MPCSTRPWASLRYPSRSDHSAQAPTQGGTGALAHHADQLLAGQEIALAHAQQLRGPRTGGDPERDQRPVPVRPQRREQLVEPAVGDRPRDPLRHRRPVTSRPLRPPLVHRVAVRVRPAAPAAGVQRERVQHLGPGIAGRGHPTPTASRNRHHRSRSTEYDLSVSSDFPEASRSRRKTDTGSRTTSAGPTTRYGSRASPVATRRPARPTTSRARSRPCSSSDSITRTS